jgi:hypothetical protein
MNVQHSWKSFKQCANISMSPGLSEIECKTLHGDQDCFQLCLVEDDEDAPAPIRILRFGPYMEIDILATFLLFQVISPPISKA